MHGILMDPDTWYVAPDSADAETINVRPDAVRKITIEALAQHTQPSQRADVSAPLQALRQANLQSMRRRPGSCSPWKVVKETGQNLLASAQQVVGALVGSAAASMISERFGGLSKATDVLASSGISLALATSMSSAATGFITSTVNTIKGACLSDKDALRETYAALVKQSREAVMQHPLRVQTAIYSLDKSVSEAFSQSSQSVAWHEQKLRHRETILMSVPFYAKDIAQWGVGDERKHVIQKRIQDLVSSYPVEMRATLDNLIQRMRANSIAENPTRVQAFLYGPSGTGKTQFVKAIANALGLPMIEIRLPLKQLDALFGYKYSVDYASPNTSDLEIIGELPQKLIKAGYTNPIVFFDEVSISNENMVDGLKLLLDGGKKAITVEAFDIELDWRRATVFCASNQKLTNAALIKRMPQLNFPAVSAKTKKTILLATFDEKMATYRDALGVKRMSDLKIACLDQVAFILENDMAPGARDLESVAENMVHFVAGGFIADDERSVDEIRAYIAGDFAHMSSADAESQVASAPAAAEPKARDADEWP